MPRETTASELRQQVRFNRILLTLTVLFSGYNLWLRTGALEVLVIVFGVGVISALLWGRLIWSLFDRPLGGDA